MRVLYAIQGTGNGHVTRARDIVPELQKRCDLSVLISGTQADIALPFPIDFQLNGLSFVFGQGGGVDLKATLGKIKPKQLLQEINSINVEDFDLIINDFEPVSAWAAKLKNRSLVALSHQAAIMQPFVPAPAHRDLKGRFILKHYAPFNKSYGFHFQPYRKGIYTPVIRKEVRGYTPHNYGHYTVYLPSYGHSKLVALLNQLPQFEWHVFSKHSKETYNKGNCQVFPVNNERFLKSMATAEGVLCGAGFETPAEALFLGKKLLVVPMRNQLEQHYNAEALRQMGVPVLPFLDKRHLLTLEHWLLEGKQVQVAYPDITAEIIETVLREQAISPAAAQPPKDDYFSFFMRSFLRLSAGLK